MHGWGTTYNPKGLLQRLVFQPCITRGMGWTAPLKEISLQDLLLWFLHSMNKIWDWQSSRAVIASISPVPPQVSGVWRRGPWCLVTGVWCASTSLTKCLTWIALLSMRWWSKVASQLPRQASTPVSMPAAVSSQQLTQSTAGYVTKAPVRFYIIHTALLSFKIISGLYCGGTFPSCIKFLFKIHRFDIMRVNSKDAAICVYIYISQKVRPKQKLTFCLHMEHD